jgi:hypothetical protein
MSNETGGDWWKPRLSPAELAAKYGPPVSPLVIDERAETAEAPAPPAPAPPSDSPDDCSPETPRS